MHLIEHIKEAPNLCKYHQVLWNDIISSQDVGCKMLSSWCCHLILVWHHGRVAWCGIIQEFYGPCLHKTKCFNVSHCIVWLQVLRCLLLIMLRTVVRRCWVEVLYNKAADGEMMACFMSSRLIESFTDHEKQDKIWETTWRCTNTIYCIT